MFIVHGTPSIKIVNAQQAKIVSVYTLPEDGPLMSRNASEERELCVSVGKSSGIHMLIMHGISSIKILRCWC
jgi:hypothetical protein